MLAASDMFLCLRIYSNYVIILTLLLRGGMMHEIREFKNDSIR